MKTTLKITLLILAASLAVAAFAGLAGFSAAAAISAKFILPAFAYAGLMLISSFEYDTRRTIRLHPARTAARPAAVMAAPRAVGEFHGACAAA
jgi:hypothetical protein